jgi:hypothetical protein
LAAAWRTLWPKVVFCFRVARRAAVLAWKAAVLTFAFLRRVLVRVLLAMETTLLDPAGRERVHATSVFALIFAFAVTSVDFLVTGGPEWSADAYAATRGAQVQSIVDAPSPISDSAQPLELRSEFRLDDHIEGLDASALLGGPEFAVARPPRPRHAPVEAIAIDRKRAPEPALTETSAATADDDKRALTPS